MSQVKSTHYTAAGVDIDAADDLIERIKPLAAATRIPGATKGLGGFGGVFDLAAAGFGEGSPRLVAGTDGVGTKLKIAFATGIHHTVGIDCVAMCVNDILAVGATPLFFLDYFGTGKLHPAVGEAVVAGIAAGCRQAGCWLLGGETAELPGMYADGEYDIAGFVVGAVRPDEELSPDDASEGDVLIGIRSSGLHSNGFSLARRVLLERSGHALERALEDDTLSLGERLLVPTRIYVKALGALREACVKYRAVAHITGGGLWENPPRALPNHLAAILDYGSVATMAHPIFDRIRREGGVPTSEMYRVFNMGVGLTLSVDAASADRAVEVLRHSGEEAVVIGRLAARDADAVVFDGMPSD